MKLDARARARARGAIVATLALVGLLAWASGVRAAEIRASVDRTEITLDEMFVLEVTVQGSSQDPVLPELPEFEVRFLGRTSQWQIVNGRMSSSESFTWSLAPRATGSFRIGQVTLEGGEGTVASEPFEVRVVAASSAPDDGSRDLFVTATVSDSSPWVGQQILYVWRLYRAVEIANPRLDPRDYDGFLLEELGEPRQGDAVVGGRTYRVTEIRLALFPQEAGRLTVPAMVLRCEVGGGSRWPGGLFDDPFRRGRSSSRVLRTDPTELDVRPLPPAPPEFSGLVGKFSLDSSLTKSEIAVGESTTLTLRLEGSGNLQMVPASLPMPWVGLAASGSGRLKSYDEEPKTELERGQNGLGGVKIFRTALVPLEPGELVLPPTRLTYFDPEAGEYQTTASGSLSLSVKPSDQVEELSVARSPGLAPAKVAVRVAGDDLAPIRTGLEALRPGVPEPGPWWWLSLALPPAAFAGFATVRRHRRRLANDRAFARRRGARAELALARQRLARCLASGGGDAAAEAASSALRRFAGDLLNTEGGAMTADEAGRELAARGVSEELAGRIRQWLGDLEAARYGGHEPAGDLLADLDSLATALEKEVPR